MNAAALEMRARLVRAIRGFFDGEGFVEVETPVRIAAPAPEPHIDCPPSGGWFLRASPELQMKRLLAEGMERIYQIGPCFREGERGRRHRPEFSMLEWYRAGAGYLEIAEDAERMLDAAWRALGLAWGGRATRLTVREAYRSLAGWDPFEEWDQDRFDEDMAVKIEPNLPKGSVFLMDYPAQAASLARLKEGDPSVAERWELYRDGVELANCFSELTDPAEQRRRFEAAKEERRRLGEADYPLDEDFLEALAVMPRAGGAALGIDRLAMLACGADDIGEVMAFFSPAGGADLV